MSVNIYGNVFYLQLEAHRKLILLSLADQASDNGRCWPSQELIATRASLSERRCRDHLHALETDGWLTVLSTGNGRGITSQYILNITRIGKEAEAVKLSIKAEKAVITSPLSSFTEKAEKADILAQKADILAQKADTSVPLESSLEPSIIEPSVNNTLHPPSDFEVPEAFKPLTGLKGYTQRNHSKAFSNITSACTESGVNVDEVVAQFAQDYPVLRHQYGWSDPVATLARGRPLGIAISKVLNGERGGSNGATKQPAPTKASLDALAKY